MLEHERAASHAPDSVSEKLSREVDLLRGLPANALKEAGRVIQEEPDKAVWAGITGFGVAAVLSAGSKNPGFLGKAAMPAVRAVVQEAPRVMIAMGAIDAAHRVAVPAAITWLDKSQHEGARQLLTDNVGSGIVEYGAGLVCGIGGAKLGWRATPEWTYKTPAFDPHPSKTLGQSPREVENPGAFRTQKETTVNDDVVTLYEKSFPAEERQPVQDVKDLVESGRIVVHTTRDNTGTLQSFSFVSMHDETAFKFANLDFIATETSAYSQGLGSLHARRLNEIVKVDRPDLLGMTLEMEAVAEPGLAPDVFAARQRRSRFYDRLDAPNMNVKYNIIDFNDPAYRGPAEWRAWIYDASKFDSVKAARLMMIDEGGYSLAPRSKPVREFDLANNYWEPNVRPLTAGILAAPATGYIRTVVPALKDAVFSK